MIPQYLVVELGPRTYVYSSADNLSYDFNPDDFTGKRHLLQHYLEQNNITGVFSIYEYALPSGRSQLVCWYYPTPPITQSTPAETNSSDPRPFDRVLHF